jgi:hypothetical protein
MYKQLHEATAQTNGVNEMNKYEKTAKLTEEHTAELSKKQREVINSMVEFYARKSVYNPPQQWGMHTRPEDHNKATLKSLAKRGHIGVTFNRYTDNVEDITLKLFYEDIVIERVLQLIDEAEEEAVKEAQRQFERDERNAYITNMLLNKYGIQPDMTEVSSSQRYSKPQYEYTIHFEQSRGTWNDGTPRKSDLVRIYPDNDGYGVSTTASTFDFETAKEMARLMSIACQIIEDGDLEEPFEAEVEEVVIDNDGAVATVVLNQSIASPEKYTVQTTIEKDSENFSINLETFETYSEARQYWRKTIKELSSKNS